MRNTTENLESMMAATNKTIQELKNLFEKQNDQINKFSSSNLELLDKALIISKEINKQLDKQLDHEKHNRKHISKLRLLC